VNVKIGNLPSLTSHHVSLKELSFAVDAEELALERILPLLVDLKKFWMLALQESRESFFLCHLLIPDWGDRRESNPYQEIHNLTCYLYTTVTLGAATHLGASPKGNLFGSRKLVGAVGLEPTTSRLSSECSSQMSYAPTKGFRRQTPV
jgi:hypothetical protein